MKDVISVNMSQFYKSTLGHGRRKQTYGYQGEAEG